VEAGREPRLIFDRARLPHSNSSLISEIALTPSLPLFRFDRSLGSDSRRLALALIAGLGVLCAPFPPARLNGDARAISECSSLLSFFSLNAESLRA
jgi:hypothetical protein